VRNLKTIRDLFHGQFLHIRNCNNLLQSDNFEIAYSLASSEERDEIFIAIAESNKDKLKSFIIDKISEGTPFEQLNMRKLREIAQHWKICKYNVLNKLSLVEEIKNVAKRLKDDSERKYIQSEQA